jgi:hypothetical protein
LTQLPALAVRLAEAALLECVELVFDLLRVLHLVAVFTPPTVALLAYTAARLLRGAAKEVRCMCSPHPVRCVCSPFPAARLAAAPCTVQR